MNKVALLFPGQGSQYVKMGKVLYDEFTSAKLIFEEACEILGFDLKKLCFEGGHEELQKTENTQPAILVSSVAAFRVYMEQVGIAPVCLAGHSLGEYSALVCSEAVKFADAVRLVRLRGRFMQEAAEQGTGAMAAISDIDRYIIEEQCKKQSAESGIVVVSNYNAPEQTVISGHREAVGNTAGKLKELGAAVTILNVSAPFHCPLMQPAADKLKEELVKIKYQSLKYPVISNVTALPYEGAGKIAEYLARQVVSPVRWVDVMQYLNQLQINIAVELGPKTVLKNLTRKNLPAVKAYAYDKSEDVAQLAETVKKPPLADNQPEKLTVVELCITTAVCTRNRNWNNDEYQKGVSEPYKKIQEMQLEIEKSGIKPSVNQMEEAIEMLRSVFATKKTPIEEQIEEFNRIFIETGTRQLFPDFQMPDKAI